MSHLFFASLIALTLGSCISSTKKSKFDNIPSSDTTCLKAVKKAKADIAKGELSFCYHAGSLLYDPLRCEQEMDSLLKPFGIGYRNVFTSDVIYIGQTQGCYGDYMNEVISNKYGIDFIDSLIYKADSVFISKNPNNIFDDHDCDTGPIFPGDKPDNNRSFNSGLQERFDEKVIYPEGFLKKPIKNKMGNIKLSLLIDKYGRAAIEQFSFEFNNDENLQFQQHFKDIFEPVITGTRWKPATIKNQNVTSTITTFLYLK